MILIQDRALDRSTSKYLTMKNNKNFTFHLIIFSRYPPQAVVPPYQPPLYNPTTAVPQHFIPTPIMSNPQFVHGLFLLKCFCQ